jgi:hypothetical protein
MNKIFILNSYFNHKQTKTYWKMGLRGQKKTQVCFIRSKKNTEITNLKSEFAHRNDRIQ